MTKLMAFSKDKPYFGRLDIDFMNKNTPVIQKAIGLLGQALKLMDQQEENDGAREKAWEEECAWMTVDGSERGMRRMVKRDGRPETSRSRGK